MVVPALGSHWYLSVLLMVVEVLYGRAVHSIVHYLQMKSTYYTANFEVVVLLEFAMMVPYLVKLYVLNNLIALYQN